MLLEMAQSTMGAMWGEVRFKVKVIKRLKIDFISKASKTKEIKHSMLSVIKAITTIHTFSPALS